MLTFGAFRLDLSAERLWHGTEVVPLTAKTFAVLHYLVEHAGQLVTRETLLEAVWGTVYVSDAALASCIRDIRRALGEPGRQPQFLETVRGRGYRFGGPVVVVPVSPSIGDLPPPAVAVPSSPLVGRDVELTRLQQRFATTLQGERQVVLITGEAGIGKTTLIDTFVAWIATERALWLGRGQCIAHHGAGEAYLPVLEAFGQMGREPGGKQLVEILEQHAPSWLLQMPGLLSDTAYEALQRRGSGSTRERMLRELAEAVETLAAVRPVVLVLEDLHWSDGATVDWLAYVARRRDPARVLVLGTYRPVEARVREHPVWIVTQDLRVHGQCVEMALGYFSEAMVATYLRQRYAGAALPDALVRLLHHRTHGNPLFLVTLMNGLVRQGVLRDGANGWSLAGGLEAVTASVPETLWQLLEQHLDQLSAADQALLEAASVAGTEFAVAAVAAVVGQPVEMVEAQCATLARRGQFLRVCGADIWPDGTVATRYGFLHDVYRETLYERVPVGRRVRWHQQIGARLVAGYGSQAREVAAEVAEHFVRGRDTVRAVPYLYYAGEQAVQRSAHHAAIAHFTHALALLEDRPDTAERTAQELQARIALGPVLMATQGYVAPDVATNYARARVLCQRGGNPSQLFPVLWGLWQCANGRTQHQQAWELGEQLLAVAQQTDDPIHLIQAHHALWNTAFHRGMLVIAQEHIVQGLRLYTPQQHHAHALQYAVDDPGVCCLSTGAQIQWLLGYPDQAEQKSQVALALAQELAHPYSLAHALIDTATIAHFRRDVQAVSKRAEAVLALGREYGFQIMLALGSILQGWAHARQQPEAGMAQMRQGLVALRAMGTDHMQPWFRVLLVEACSSAGLLDEGCTLLDDALRIAQTTGERVMEAELYRLKGELLRVHAATRHAEAEACIRRALAVASQQQARSLELRAATSLSRLWQQQGRRAEAYALLAPVYHWFTEGLNTADLQDAGVLLEALGS
jgi:predicted ATPase/DNA-binding winged helix-turn-helix (wHTH) protein